jgi:WD40 repeat protein
MSLRLFVGHGEAVLSVSFSPDGRQLASGSGDTTVRFWDLGTQTPMYTCTGLIFKDDKPFFVSAKRNLFILIKARNNQIEDTLGLKRKKKKQETIN